MNTRSGGFLDAPVDEFDSEMFGISGREAATMDPQQRLLLEVTWEALEHAGVVIGDLKGSRTGVFMGINTADYLQLLSAGGLGDIDAYVATGNTASVAAGRISYLLGLQGPSVALDTACSSSLVALHLACQSLRTGECDLAIVAGVNLLLSPATSIGMAKLRALAADGRCKAFDAARRRLRSRRGLRRRRPRAAIRGPLAKRPNLGARGGSAGQPGRPQRRTHRAQWTDAAGADRRSAGGGRRGSMPYRLRGGARHRDTARRPDRAASGRRSPRPRASGGAAGRGRVGEDQHRAP